MQFIFIISLIFAIPCHSLFILLPLYLYPDTSASAWSNVTAAIAANKNVQWQIIVNPNSGPGTYPPDANYIAAISKLNSYPNVVNVGYVATGYTRVSYESLTAQIDVYARWASYPDADIAVAGIFFDEVSNTATEEVYTYYQRASDYVSSKNLADGRVVFNPGAPAPARLFNYADTIVQYENALSSYKGGETIDSFQPGFNNQTCVMIHSAAEDVDVNPLVRTMVERGIQSVYFGVDCCYQAFSSELLGSLVSAVSAG